MKALLQVSEPMLSSGNYYTQIVGDFRFQGSKVECDTFLGTIEFDQNQITYAIYWADELGVNLAVFDGNPDILVLNYGS